MKSGNNQNKQDHEQQSSCAESSPPETAPQKANHPEDIKDVSSGLELQGCSYTESPADIASHESELPVGISGVDSPAIESCDTSEILLNRSAPMRGHSSKNRQRRVTSFFIQKIINELRLDDYHLLSWRERREHFFWLLGFDRFPFRERGWVIVFMAFFVALGGLWLSNPTSWDIYKNWRANEHYKRAEDALQSGQVNTAQIYLRNAYRHTPNDIKILEKLLETIPKTDSISRIGVLFEIMNIRPSGETAASIVDELLETKNIFEAASYSARQVTLYQDCGSLWFSAGKAYLMQKRFAVAREAFERAKKLLPEDKNIDFHLALAEVLMTPQGESPDFSALESFQKIPELRQSVMRTLTALYLSTDPDRAQGILDSILAENPGEWELQFLHFRLRLDKSQDNKAQDVWEDIWSRADTLERRLMVISEAVAQDLREIAECFMARLSNEDRTMASSKWIQMLIHITYKQWLDALSIAKEALENTKLTSDWQLRFLAGMSLVQQQIGKNQDSFVFYSEAARLAREDPRLVFFLSELLLRLNLQDYAVDSFERAATMESPFKEPALQRLLGIYKSRMDWNATFMTLERLNNLDPSNNSYIIQISSMLLVERKTNHPIISSLLSVDPENLLLPNEALDLIAHAHAQIGNSSKASRVLQQLEQGQTVNSHPNIHRIATLAYLSKKDAAASAYAQLLNERAQIHEKEKKYLEEIIGR